MSVKALFITLLLAACLYLGGKGAWDFGNGLLDLRREKIREAELAAQGFEGEDRKPEIRKKIYIGAAMGFVGIWGLFAYVSRTTRKNIVYTDHSKTNKTT